MSTLQVTTITTVNNTTPLILQTGNTGGGQIVLQAGNNDIQFNGPLRFTANIVGDGSGLTLPTANVANAAYVSINAGYTVTNSGYVVANAAFGKANNALANTADVTFAGRFNIPDRFLVTQSTSGTNGILVNMPTDVETTAAGIRVKGYSPAVELIDKDSVQNWYMGIDDNDSNKLIFGRGYGPGQGVTQAITVDTSDNVGIGTTSPSYKLDVSGAGRVTTSFRSPIYYDSDNTAYYLDPAGTSNEYKTIFIADYATGLGSNTSNFGIDRSVAGAITFNNTNGPAANAVTGAITFAGGGWAAQAGIWVRNDAGSGTHMALATTDSYAAGPQVGQIIFNTGQVYFPRSYVLAAGSFRAPLFYDSDNTGYYVDAAGTSNFVKLTLNPGTSGITTGLYINGGDITAARSSTTGVIYFGSDSSSRYLYHDGTNYSFGNYGYVSIPNSTRSPIFYDSDNTTYYCDPGTSSYFNRLLIKNAGADTPLKVYQYGGTSASPTEIADWPYPVLSLRGYGDFYLQTMISFGLPGDADYQANDNIWNFKLNGVNANGWDNNGNLTPKTSTDSTVGLQLLGPGNLRIGSVNAKNVYIRTNNSDRVTVDSSGNMTVTGYVYAPGSVVQVQATAKTSTTSIAVAGNSWNEFDSAFRVTITPKSSSSKIAISAYITGAQNTGTVRYKFQFSTNGGSTWSDVTPIGDAVSNRSRGHFGYAVNGDTNQFNTCSMELVHSPATTSAIIYRIQFGQDVSTTYHFNRSINYPDSFLGGTMTSTIIAKEIAA